MVMSTLESLKKVSCRIKVFVTLLKVSFPSQYGKSIIGLRHGSGTFVAANEERWDGFWCNDVMKTKKGHMIHLGGNSKLKEQASFEEVSIHD